VYALVPLARGDGPGSLLTLAEAIVTRAAEALSVDLRAGVGSTVASLAELASCRGEADAVLDVLGAGPRAATVDHVRAQVVLHRLSQLAERHPELAGGRLTAVAEHDAARGSANLATLRAYFDSFGDVAAAAALVGVHPNTFRYRLRRIQEAFGLDLSDPDERLVAELQLRWWSGTAGSGPFGPPAPKDGPGSVPA
jgi:DNA-binding PucR family transcriptional regulator